MIALAQLRAALESNPGHALRIVLPDGSFVAEHFHVTEVGKVTRDFVDCGGTRRSVSACVLQTLVANDVEHRLDAGKLGGILELAADLLLDPELPVEVEYDFGTASQFPVASLAVSGGALQVILETKHSACLAPDKCGLEGSSSPTPSRERAEFLKRAPVPVGQASSGPC